MTDRNGIGWIKPPEPPPVSDPRPIGVFDSGVGGLSVLRAIRDQLPGEDLIYIADSGHAPYGEKTQAAIRQRAWLLTRFLLEQNVKAVVLACNTATAAAVQDLRAHFALPILGMEPAVKPAVAVTRRGVVGVLATTGTLDSARFAALLDRFGSGIRVQVQPCPGLVERVEQGDLDGPQTRALLAAYVEPLLAQGADTLILGCTHYPFLRPLLMALAGPDVAIIDTGAAVARHLARRLDQADLCAERLQGGERFWTSGDRSRATRVMSRLWGRSIQARVLPGER